MQDLIAKAATLLEALPYVQRFRSQTFVVKYGGSLTRSSGIGLPVRPQWSFFER